MTRGNRHVETWRRALSLLTAISLIATQLAFPPRAAAAPGSSTASAGSVPPPGVSAIQSFQPDLFTGRATTSVPIIVPPGRKGMQPNLALTYSSSARNGWLGVGWSLDAGYIERSTKNGPPTYDSSDTYTFMFQGVISDLVKIPDGTYRAKDEGLFLRFESTGVAGWEVRDTSGTRYLFGQDAASQVASGGNAFRWCLDKVIDLNGNSLSLTYTKDQGQLYLSQIRYTAHEPSGLSPANQIDFILESRPDIDTTYRSGVPITTAKRLKTIEVQALDGDSLRRARRYTLSYAQSGRTGRSLLTSITQFGTDGTTSLPATTFTYQETGSANYSNILSNIVPPPSVAGWNVRKANLDTGHDTWGCAHPYLGLPWGSPTQTTGSFDLGCVWGSVGGNGDVTMSGCNDHFGHLWTYVYVAQAKTISLSNSGCLYREDATGVSQITSPGSLSLAAGWSIIHMTDYHQHSEWGPSTVSGGLKNQVDVMNPAQIPLGVPQLAGDVNGDAKTDLIRFNPSNGNWTISCATSCTLLPPGTWLSGFGNNASTPLLGDWNGDGKTDIGIFTSGSWQFATSTGTSFQTGTVSPIFLGSGTPLTGDFNGDAITDIGTYNNGAWSVALGTGSGFAPAASFNFSWGNSNHEPLTGDFNGDGFTDIGVIEKSSGNTSVAFSTGSAFATQPTNWINGFGPNQPHTSADFNGDGLTDAVYYNRPTGQVLYAPSTGSGFSAAVTLPLTFSLTAFDDNIQVGDFNGDGIADPAAFNLLSGSSQLALSSLTNSDGSNGTAPDLLRTVANGLGGTTTISYQPSSLCGCAQQAILPFVLPVVQKTTQDDGLGHSYATTHLFHGGMYDGPSKEFRGFEEATVFDADGNKSVTQFHQDDQKKGRPFHAEFRDANGSLWTASDQAWSVVEPYPGVRFVRLDQTDGFTYDGDATFRQTRSRFDYDQYGNVTASYEDGEPSVSGDERAHYTTFVTNTSAWILKTPSLTQTVDASGAVVAQRRFHYDNAADTTTPPALGRLTKEEEWLNSLTGQPANPPTWLPTRLTYDAYGNVATVIDALGRTTTNTYDDTGTYLIRIANALGHTRQLTYDPRFGQVTSTTDSNSITTTTEYDALGRVAKVIGPNDSATLPTISYEYDLSTIPTKTVTHVLVQSGSPLHMTHYTFHNGLGRTIQIRSPAEDPAKQVVSGAVELNSRGRTVKQWTPYLSSISSSYVPLSLEPSASSLVSASYTYDAMGRLLTTTDPDGTVTSISYDDWSVTSADANGHQTRRTQDAYGRLSRVEEFNNGQTYTTIYAYDTLGNLTRVDQWGQSPVGTAPIATTRITYDSLGRKIAMDDPDMGHWTYAYNAVDNLTLQTDARGVVITFTYDTLNRLTQKSYTVPPALSLQPTAPVSYTYDDVAKPFSKGKLTGITDGSGSSSFEYDNFGRLTKESKTIDGTTSIVQRAYDLLGRLTSLTYPNNEVATYTYNSQGGIETVALDSPVAGRLSLVAGIDYNAAGQLTKITYGNGVVTDYSYNPQTLRLDSLRTMNPEPRTLQDFSYQFDAVGNVTQITDRVHTATQSFGYDDLNRLTSASGAYGSYAYAYDPLGNMTSKEGVTMTYGVNAGPHAVTSVHGPQSIVRSLTYDANGNLTRKAMDYGLSTMDQAAQLFEYDAENRLAKVSTAAEETVTVTFKPGWNFFSLPVILEDASIAMLFPSFSADFEQIAKFVPASSLEPSAFSHYVGNPTFDDFSSLEYGVGYQIYRKSSSDITVTFRGKLPTQQLSRSLAVGWHLLPASSLQPSALSQVFGGLDYDQLLKFDPAAGSLQPATGVLPAQAYYVHLRTAGTFAPSLPRDPTTRFIYDGDGGRVKQITASGTTTYLGELVEKDSSGKTTNYIFAGSQRIAAVTQSPQPSAPSQVRFYHADHLGSSNVITDSSGTVVEHTEHTPYGTIAAHSPQPSTPSAFGFTGQRQDAGTGLVLFPGRAYDPQLGRFLQPDPFVQAPDDPQSLNRYSYVRNNPINLVDPSGYGWLRTLLRVVAVVLAVVATVVTAGAASPTIAAAVGLTEAAIASAGSIAAISSGLAYASYSASNSIGRGSGGGATAGAVSNLVYNPAAGVNVIAEPGSAVQPGQVRLLGGPNTQQPDGQGPAPSLRLKAAKAGQAVDETVTLLPGISPAGPRFVHQRADGSRYWSSSPRPTPGGELSPLRKAAKSLTTYYNDPGRILRTTGRGLSEYGHPGFGRPMSITGLALEPGGTGKIVGIAAGGTAGATLGRQLGIYIGGSAGGPLGGIAGGVGGGFIGGAIGGWFDSPYEGELE